MKKIGMGEMITVRTVNGYPIEKMSGTKGPFEVTIKTFYNKKGEYSGKKYQVFRTIKAAAAFAETLPLKQ